MSEEYAAQLETYSTYVSWLFIIEMGMKQTGMGCAAYWADGWNQLDGCIVIMSIVEMVLTAAFAGSGVKLSFLRILRMLRIARMLRLMKAWKGLYTIVMTVVAAIPQMSNVLVLMFLINLIFALLGMQIFGGVYNAGNGYEPLIGVDLPLPGACDLPISPAPLRPPSLAFSRLLIGVDLPLPGYEHLEGYVQSFAQLPASARRRSMAMVNGNATYMHAAGDVWVDVDGVWPPESNATEAAWRRSLVERSIETEEVADRAAVHGRRLKGGQNAGGLKALPRYHFDYFVPAIISVFILTTGNWFTPMLTGVDAVGPPAAGYYILVMAIGTWILVNLFVAILLQLFSADADGDGKADAFDVTSDKVSNSPGPSPNRGRPSHEESFLGRETDPKDVSLCMFHKRDPTRVSCRAFIENETVETVLMVAVIISSLLLILDNPRLEAGSPEAVAIYVANLFFTALFTGEAALKSISYATLKQRNLRVISV